MKKYFLIILLAFAMLAPQCLADPSSGYSWDQYWEPWDLATTATGNSIHLTWKAPTAFAMTSDNGYVVLIQKDSPINTMDVFLTNSKLLEAAAFEPLGTTQHTFTGLAEGTYYLKVGVGLCQPPQEGMTCQWVDVGYFSIQDLSAQVASGAKDAQLNSVEANAKLMPDLTIKVAKATLVKRTVKGVSKKQYKIGVTVQNKGGDAVGDITYSFADNAPVLAAKGGLKAGKNKKVFVYVETTEKGKKLLFTVDPGNTVDESNEDNNTASRVIGK